MPPGPKSKHHAALGAALRELREAKTVKPRRGTAEVPLSQEALADKAHLHRNYIGAVERGEVNVAFDNLRRIAEALDVELSEVMRLYESKRPPRRR